MKNLKMVLMLLISISIVATSCKKDDKDDVIPVVPGVTYLGSFNLDINNVTFSTLLSNVEEMDEGVTFFTETSSGTEIQIALPDVPAIGVTHTITIDQGEDDPTFVILGDIGVGDEVLVATSGTIKRTSSVDYEVDVLVYGVLNPTTPYPVVGVIEVGKIW